MSKNTIYITGHKNPDADSIISAMAYAYLKQHLGLDAMAVRIGEINKETAYILSLFNETAPPFVSNIYSRIRDIEFDEVVTCREDDSLYTALEIMKKNHKKVIAVTDAANHLLGISTISDIVSPMMPNNDSNNRCIRETPIERICDFIDGTLVYKSDTQHTNGHVRIIASRNDTSAKDGIVIVPDDVAIGKDVINHQAATLIVIGEQPLSEELIELAKENQCNLIQTQGSMYTIAKNIYYASPIKLIMSTQLTCFEYDDLVEDVKVAINNSRYRSYPILDTHRHVVGMISRYHLFKNTSRNLILVDHNELSQSIDGAESANILEIVDHHRLGGMQTNAPAYVRNERLGCCSTIISRLFKENDVPLTKDMAGLLCCAIISDTVNFKSVTCTETDKAEARELALKAGMNIEETAMKILMAGTSLDEDAEVIFHRDLKRFDIRKKAIAVGQCNIAEIDDAIQHKAEFEKVLSGYCRDSGCAIALMCFTRIDGKGSYLLANGPEVRLLKTLLEEQGKEQEGFVFFENMISRKQQIIPMLSQAIG